MYKESGIYLSPHLNINCMVNQPGLLHLLYIHLHNIQISNAPFSLEHPSQFYLESRKIREGIKQEKPSDQHEVNITDTEFADLTEKDLNGFDDMDTL